MVIKKFVISIYNLIKLGIPLHPRIKVITSHELCSFRSNGPVKVNGGRSVGLEGEICCVCLSKLREDEDIRVLYCSHKFHKACVDRWFNTCKKTCPICRFSMIEEERLQRKEMFTEEMVIWFSSFHVAGF